ncbi:hypothetical protein H4R19_002353 [Coemansia spiralis]|nr:hypothetical protein H4R19_002353 [Coemansia spiralis]
MSGSGDESSGSELDAYRCPICLQPVDERCYTDPCYHLFCFACLVQWLEHSLRCPLCNSAVAAAIQQEPSGRIVRTRIAARPLPPAARPARPATPYGRDQRVADARESLGLRKRTAVYQHGLRRAATAAPLGSAGRARVSQSAELLRAEIGRARSRAWIRRDLQAALGIEDVAMVEALVVRLAADGGTLAAAAPTLERLLAGKTDLFLDELAAYLDSSLDMHSYDIYVAYDTRAPD